MNTLERLKMTSWWERMFLDPAPARTLVRWIVGLSVIVNLMALVQPVFMLHVYDYVLPSQSLSTLGFLVLIACFLIAVSSALEYLRSRYLSELAMELDLQVRERAFMGSYRRGIAEGTLGQGSFAADIDTLKSFLIGPGFVALIDLPWAPIFLVALFLLSPWLCLVTVAFGAAVLTIAILAERRTNTLVGQAAAQQRAAAKMAEDVFHGAESIEAMGFSRAVLNRWVQQVHSTAAFTQVANARGGSAQTLIKALRVMLQVALLATSAILVLRGQLTGGVMIAATIIGARALAPIDQIVGAWKSLALARASWTQLLDTVEAENQVQFTRRTKLPRPKGDLVLRNVAVMSAETRAPIVQGVSMAIPAGTHLAIVGPSGSGKSTVARVLAGAVRASYGDYLIDGADFYSRPREALGAYTGYVPQSPRLLTGTIAEVIRRFGPPDDAGVIKAAQLAGAHNLIMRLPDGYDTHIGQAGWTLSGGQATMVQLAAAAYGDPVLVVLDEPFAHLDAEAIAAVHAAVVRLRQRGATVVVVAHRPADIGSAAMVAVMLNGKLARFGAAEDVMSQIVSRPGEAAASVPAAGGAQGAAA